MIGGLLEDLIWNKVIPLENGERSEAVLLVAELTVVGLQKLVDDYVTERDWKRYHKPKDIAISIAIESSELLELFQ